MLDKPYIRSILKSKLSEVKYWGKAGAGIVVHSGGKILLGRRSGKSNEPFTWSFPGGKVEPDEDTRKAALREFKEETGYSGVINSLKKIHVYKDRAFEYHTFLGHTDEQFDAEITWEHDQFEWFDLRNLPEPLHFGLQIVKGKIRNELHS